MRTLRVPLAAFVLLSSTVALAAPSERAFVGGLLGYSSASDNVGSGLGYGIRGGYTLADPWGVGLFFQSADHENGISSRTMGLEAIYRLEQFMPGASVALDLATAKFSGPNLTGEYNLGVGGRAIYDVRLAGSTPISVGAELSVLFTKPGDDMLLAFNALGSVKFWF